MRTHSMLATSLTFSSLITALQDVFQVEAPLRATYDGTSCQRVVLQHEFAFSYGLPYVGTYSPPNDCTFTTTIFNLSVVSAGINYDRLGLLFFGDIEIWRTTTAMPTRTGIYWNFLKDMTIYDTLLRSDQKVIMELDNLYDSVFTGPYNVTITALYYDDHYPQPLTPADQILPISTRSSAQNTSSVISLPDGNATVSYTFPPNAERAVISILASGNGAEEFWYTNVPTDYMDTFNNSAFYGFSPFREVQLFIDGQLAGVEWPFPIVFTGGISPGLWVPIVGIDTYDLPSFEIDISPFLGILCDGKPHTFEMKVVGYDSKTLLGTVGSNWWITGSIFIWLDSNGTQTTGTALESFTPLPEFGLIPHITTSPNGTNSSLRLQLTAHRTLSHSATITTSKGSHTQSWSQLLDYKNTENYTALGFNLSLAQLTNGIASSITGFDVLVNNFFSYPIDFTQSYIPPINQEVQNSTLIASLDRSLISNATPLLPYLTSSGSFPIPEILDTRQNGTCVYFWNNTYYEFAGAIDPAMGTVGETEQWFSYLGPPFQGQGGDVQYGRHVKALDGYEPRLVEDATFDHVIFVPPTTEVPGQEL